MNNLMELVDSTDRHTGYEYKAKEAQDFIQRLRGLGLHKAADKAFEESQVKSKLALASEYHFIKISEEKIEKFLVNKATEYNKSHPFIEEKKKPANSGYMFLISDIWERTQPECKAHYAEANPLQIYVQTNDFHKNDAIGKYQWTETPLATYGTIPPAEVLDVIKLNQDRKIFDYISIAEVNEVEDPLLLGRIKGSKDRFFLYQWGKDVNLDDVI